MQPFGDAAWRFDRPSGPDTAALLAVLQRWPGVVDAVVTERHCCVTFDAASPIANLGELEARCARAAPLVTAVREHLVRVCYDGPDLEHVAQHSSLSVERVIELHASGDYKVGMLGFQPGFGYLVGINPRIAVPRRDSPRTRVPAGSVAIGGPYTGIYPFATPGGWNLIGTAPDFQAFTSEAAVLQPGDRVRFARND